uniref:Variant surface glycoprotein 690 n=1 Tax=Trypanosoma brucei TaxID=5691 RepID=M4SXR0_9TRYP|nr:variant surface glycoprotein 690 [Trypanosoma brucei]
MFIIRGALITTVLATVIRQARPSAPGLDSITKPCHEAQYLEKVAQDLEDNLNSATSTLKQLTDDYMTLMLITTCPQTNSQAPKAAIIAAQTARAAKSLARETESKRPVAQKVIKILRQRADQIYLADRLHTSVLATTGQAASALHGGGEWIADSNEHACKIALASNSVPAVACPKPSGDGDYLSTATEQLKTKAKTKLADDTFFTMPVTTIDVRAFGNLAGSQLSVKTADWCVDRAGGKGTQTLGVGIKEVTRTAVSYDPGVQDLKTITGGDDKCNQLGDEQQTKLTTKKLTAQALCSSLTAKITIPARPLTTTEATLAAEREVQKLLQLMNDGSIDTTKLDTSAKEQAAKLMPSSTESTQKTIFEKLTGTEITYKYDQADRKVAANKAGEDAEYGKIYALCFGQQRKALTAGSNGEVSKNEPTKPETKDKTEDKEDGDKKATAAECTATEEGKCDKTKCDWKKDKNECKVKERAVIISAVNKVPVLLALFLPIINFVKNISLQFAISENFLKFIKLSKV